MWLGCEDGTVCIVDIDTHDCIYEWQAHKSALRLMSVIQDSENVVTGGTAGAVPCFSLCSICS